MEQLDCPIIMNASGCWVSEGAQIDKLYYQSNLGAIVLKTCTLQARDGNRIPNYCQVDGVTFNCKGVPNYGYAYYKNILDHYRNTVKTTKPIVLSVLVNGREDELDIILKDYDNLDEKPKLVELNVSCPNAKKMIIGYHRKHLQKLLDHIREMKLKTTLISLKLPPQVEQAKIVKLGELFLQCSDIVKYIVCGNSISNGYPINEMGEKILTVGVGGMSGTAVNKYLGLGNVQAFYRILSNKIGIIGCGGIATAKDVQDYLSIGACAVQLGSCFYDLNKDELNIHKINDLIENVSSKVEIDSILRLN